MPGFNETLWTVGWVVGGVVVVVVAVLALALIGIASSIRRNVLQVQASLEHACDSTAALWGLRDTCQYLGAALGHVRELRGKTTPVRRTVT